VSDQLFRTQEAWTKDGNVAAAACSILNPADARKVRALAASPETAKQLEQDIRDGKAESVNGTPTIIITKLMRRWPVVGPVSYPVLSRFLDSILN
jgi:protein-disulfide isomerase